jgi:hypothetical protein
MIISTCVMGEKQETNGSQMMLLPCLSMHLTIPPATPLPTVVSVVRRGHRGSEVHLQGAAAVVGMDDKEDKIVGR